MPRRQCLRSAAGLGAGILLAPPWAWAAAGSARCWDQRRLVGFGTTLSLTVGADTAQQVDRALDAGVADIRRIEALMSLFRSDSALQQLNAQRQWARPDPWLLDVLQRARQISQRSQGAFDVTVQPLWTVWQQAQAAQQVPEPQQLADALQRVGWQHVLLAPERIALARSGMALTLNGIAQGYAADRVRQRWQHMGVRHALIDCGEWTALGQDAQGRGWQLGIADPRDAQRMIRRVAASGLSVATSADSQTYFTPDRRNHHILNPHTGRSPTGLASVTVVAEQATLADALTKVLFMAASPEQALQQARRWGVLALAVGKDGRWRASPGL
ncbi:MAG: FAD:protein FMN transferase [Rhodoferax sp.]